jgi:hypothetical protein
MKKSKKICRTDATAILKFYSFEDGTFAFFYEVRKKGLVKYFVNCNGKVFGPYEEVDESQDEEYNGEAGKTFREFLWIGKIDGENYVFKNGKKIKKEETVSSEKVCKMLDKMCEDIKEYEKSLPDEEYDEKTHILEDRVNKCEWFVTPKEKFGPYHKILQTAYKDENHFQFIYKKESDDDFSFYNLNGNDCKKLYDPTCFAQLFYDSRGRAFVTNLYEKYILIDGEENYPLGTECLMINYCEKNGSGYEVISGDNFSRSTTEIKCNGNHVYADWSWCVLQDGSIAYSHGYENKAYWSASNGGKETRISAMVHGEKPKIFGHIVQFEKCGLSYLMIEGREYPGMVDVGVNGKAGFVFVKVHNLYFYEYETPRLFGYSYNRGGMNYTDVCEIEKKNIEDLIRGKLIAGECEV